MSRFVKKKIRSAVSADRIRFKDGEYDLDLTYITDSIIAMAIPGEGVETTWRNNINEVASMLSHYHAGSFMIYNLSEKQYDYSKFNDMCLEFPFPDHHPPPLDVLFKVILSMENWLAASPDHVAVVHCKGGKGRTGTVVACYLTFSGLFSDPEEALEYFAAKRSAISYGVTQPSQLRYVRYFSKILENRLQPVPKRLYVHRIIINEIPDFGQKHRGFCPYLELYDASVIPKRLVWSTPEETVRPYSKEEGLVIWDLSDRIVSMEGDVLIQAIHRRRKFTGDAQRRGQKKRTIDLFRCSFHTSFASEGIMQFSVDQLDGIKKSHLNRYPANFQLQIIFMLEPPPGVKRVTVAGAPISEEDELEKERIADVYMKVFKRLRSDRADRRLDVSSVRAPLVVDEAFEKRLEVMVPQPLSPSSPASAANEEECSLFEILQELPPPSRQMKKTKKKRAPRKTGRQRPVTAQPTRSTHARDNITTYHASPPPSFGNGVKGFLEFASDDSITIPSSGELPSPKPTSSSSPPPRLVVSPSSSSPSTGTPSSVVSSSPQSTTPGSSSPSPRLVAIPFAASPNKDSPPRVPTGPKPFDPHLRRKQVQGRSERQHSGRPVSESDASAVAQQALRGLQYRRELPSLPATHDAGCQATHDPLLLGEFSYVVDPTSMTDPEDLLHSSEELTLQDLDLSLCALDLSAVTSPPSPSQSPASSSISALPCSSLSVPPLSSSAPDSVISGAQHSESLIGLSSSGSNADCDEHPSLREEQPGAAEFEVNLDTAVPFER